MMKKEDGFTLIELLVTITILSVLATGVFIVINPTKRFNQAKDARIKSDINQISTGLMSYYTINRIFPLAPNPGLAALEANKDIKVVPKAPGGSNYFYVVSGACAFLSCEAVTYFPLYDPTLGPGSIWCWKSTTGKATEVVAGACIP